MCMISKMILLLCITALNIISLRSESLDYSQISDRQNTMYPMFPSQREIAASSQNEIRYELNNDDKMMMISRLKDLMLRKFLNLDKSNENWKTDNLEPTDDDEYLPLDRLKDWQLTRLSNELMRYLYLQPASLVTENLLATLKSDQADLQNDIPQSNDNQQKRVSKRVRFYMPYPFVGKTSRTHTNANLDICNPSKNDVRQLLAALHKVKQGNGEPHLVKFCNKKRLAGAIFTNIRFLGRKRK